MSTYDKPDLSRSAGVWVRGGHAESCRLCTQECRNAGSRRVACELHTENKPPAKKARRGRKRI